MAKQRALAFEEEVTKRDQFYQSVGETVKSHREKLRLSVDDLALKINKSPEFIYALERGTLCLSLWNFHKVMNALEEIESERN